MALVSAAVPFADNWYFDTLLRGVRERVALGGHEVDVQVAPFGAGSREQVAERLDRELADPRVVGAVALGFNLRPEQAERVLRHGKPVVVTGGASPDLPAVRVDDVEVGRLATEHLLSLGHRAIAHVGGYSIAPDHFPMRSDRIRGYSEAMRSAGLDALSQVRPVEFRFDAAHRQATDLLSSEDRPTAVFAVTDEVAFAVLAAAQDLGLRVPRDLSVIGVDDHPHAQTIALTTLRHDPSLTGAAAADRLLGRTTEDDQVMEVELVARSSTAPPRGVRVPADANRGAARLLARLLHRERPVSAR